MKLGLIGVSLCYSFYFMGLYYSTAFNAGLLEATIPLVTLLISVISSYLRFDGIDLDIEASSLATADQALQVIVLIQRLRDKFNTVTNKHLLITITPESVTVVNTVPAIGGGWNAMVPVIDLALDNIDFIQVQEYNDNPYGDTPGTDALNSYQISNVGAVQRHQDS